MSDARILVGDCIARMRDLTARSVHTCITSPPYFGLRDYGVDGQIGIEPTPEEFVAKLVEVFREVRRVLRDDGTLWLNLGDSYAGGNTPVEWREGSARSMRDDGHSRRNRNGAGAVAGPKPKDLIGIPWRVAFALQSDGWYLRQDIIWHKPNPMPESVRDRCTKAHEYIFLLSKSPKYYFDHKAMQDPCAKGAASTKPRGPGNIRPTKGGRAYADGSSEFRSAANLHEIGARQTRNRRDVWTIPSSPFKGAHFATFPPGLVEPCVMAGCPIGGMVLDPFNGAGTTGLVALQNQRNYIGCELNPDYAEMSKKRIREENPLLNNVEVDP